MPVDLSDTITTSTVPETNATYRISGLEGFTALDGSYVLTVNVGGIQDLAGNAGNGAASDTWVMDMRGEIRGTTWNDWDGDGDGYTGEPGLSGQTVELNMRAGTGQLLQSFVNPAQQRETCLASPPQLSVTAYWSAPRDDARGTNAGAAYLLDGTTGNVIQTFYEPGAVAGNQFGQAVAALGDKVLISSYLSDGGTTTSGAAYLFNSVTAEHLLTLVRPTAAPDYFAASLTAVEGNVLVGAYGGDANTVLWPVPHICSTEMMDTSWARSRPRCLRRAMTSDTPWARWVTTCSLVPRRPTREPSTPEQSTC